MSTKIEVQTATPREHAEFVGDMLEFAGLDDATVCTMVPSAALVKFMRRSVIIGGACYVSGRPVSSDAALIHLFGLLEGHRGNKAGALALGSLEKRMAQEGIVIALLEPLNDAARGWFGGQGYGLIPHTKYLGKPLPTQP